jgi:hypothetical protein
MRLHCRKTALNCIAAIGAMLAFTPGGMLSAHAQGGSKGTSEDGSMKIRIIIEGQALSATLDDSTAAKDFASLLPLDLTLSDYASTEKVSDLPRRLSTDGAPRSYKPSAGDITYYAPWGNLAIFYRGFSDSAGLVRLGAFDDGVEALRRDQPFKARFEVAE